MSIFRQIPPTAGFPIYAKDILALLSRPYAKEALEEDFKKYLGVPFAQVTYSGTAAFYFILESINTLSPKKTVIIPSFTCPLIPLAIKRAGLKVLACDINKDNFDFNISGLSRICKENQDVLAIVPTHLGGIPSDLASIQDIAGKCGSFVIEDCAQSLGAAYKGKKTGSGSDFSFFSLCRGKGLTIYEGGAAVAKESRYARLLTETSQRLSPQDHYAEALKIAELFGYWIFYRPSLFWFAFRMPQLFWLNRNNPIKAAGEYYTLDFSLHQVSNFRKKLGHVTFPRIDGSISGQREKTAYYLKLLKGLPGIKPVTENPGDASNYPYLTLLFEEPERRNRVLRALEGLGLGVSRIYLSAINEYPYLENMLECPACPNASYMAKRHITLSTSAYIRETEIERVTQIIRKT
jgi:dTDP-4-amino-4,6-dideoxygalactose transaminase